MDPVMNGAHGRHYVRLAGAQHEAIVRLREENARLAARLRELGEVGCLRCGEPTEGWLVDGAGDHVVCPVRHGLAAAVAPAPLQERRWPS
jgi:hypothetical protein